VQLGPFLGNDDVMGMLDPIPAKKKAGLDRKDIF